MTGMESSLEDFTRLPEAKKVSCFVEFIACSFKNVSLSFFFIIDAARVKIYCHSPCLQLSKTSRSRVTLHGRRQGFVFKLYKHLPLSLLTTQSILTPESFYARPKSKRSWDLILFVPVVSAGFNLST